MSLDDVNEETNVMLTWLEVSDKTSPMPSISASWHHQGIGQFMFIIPILKQCASFANGGNIEIFVQCHKASAF